VRLLIASFAPLRPEVGAGQMALELAAALAARGHCVVTWEPAAPPPGMPSRLHTSWRRAELERFVQEHAPFDALDAPPLALTYRLTRLSNVVARTIQPDWLYWRIGFANALRRGDLRSAVAQLAELRAQARVMYGFLIARRVVCLGPQEEAWMHRWLPMLGDRLLSYDNALPAVDRDALEKVRASRRSPNNRVRWLWIGRFAPHKAPELALHWFAERLRTHPDDHLTFAGCGEKSALGLPPALRQWDHIHFVPGYQRAELPNLLAAHDAGLFTSVAEGWGLSLQEMLESGMPVFATDAGGASTLREFFPEGLHAFPPPSDWSAQNWTPAHPARTYRPRFSWCTIAGRYESEVLDKLPSVGSAR
jgi:glycosyltransferase involved in cell wall biosynthesis